MLVLIIAGASTFLGMAGKLILPDLASSNNVIAALVVELFPHGLKGLVLIGVLSAIMSTADISVLTGSASLTKDIYQRYFHPEASEKTLMRVGLAASLFVGVLGAVFGWFTQDIMNILLITFTINSAGLFLPTIGAFFWKKSCSAGAFASMLSATIIAIVWFIGGKVSALPLFSIDALWPSFGVSAVLYVIICLTHRQTPRSRSRPSDSTPRAEQHDPHPKIGVYVTMEQKKKMPLEGIRVVELATVVAAPTASRVLCAFGAEVIKVETRIGDEMRRAGEFEMVVCEDDKNPLFTIQNSGKRLTSIDLKNPDGKAAMLRLLETADVFLTNVRLPSLGRLGLDYETLHAAYPGLVYAHFSGFGPKGPDAAKPGFDSTAFWLRSGPMADWQAPGSFPFTPTYAFGDMATSSAFLSGILMALIGKKSTGMGTFVSTSLFASGHLVQRHRRRVAPAAVRW